MSDKAVFRNVTEAQQEFEKAAISAIFVELEKVSVAGYDYWQTLTSCIANLLAEVDDPQEVLTRLTQHISLKIDRIRQMNAN